MTTQHRVLLVDDAAQVRSALRSLLESVEGVEIVGEATNGREAALMAVRLQPTAVLLDLKMPVLEGLWALPLLRAALPTARIVILSSYVSTSARRQALESGAAAVLEKGVDPEVLLATLLSQDPPPA
ncbi:MAG: response regulator [Ardenticatenaceae bacterium]|nr:response regulator [Ardenticatenaceae bacterium]HBY98322.1 hypothetical protein [Chloroflexota bacterium]